MIIGNVCFTEERATAYDDRISVANISVRCPGLSWDVAKKWICCLASGESLNLEGGFCTNRAMTFNHYWLENSHQEFDSHV